MGRGQTKSVGEEWTILSTDRTQATRLPGVRQPILLGNGVLFSSFATGSSASQNRSLPQAHSTTTHSTLIVLQRSSIAVIGLTGSHVLVTQFPENCIPPAVACLPCTTWYEGIFLQLQARLAGLTGSCQGISCSYQFLTLLCSSLLSNRCILSHVGRL